MKRCADCMFAELELMQGQLSRVLVCHHSPPALIGAQTPQGFMAIAQFPVVQPAMFCHQFNAKHGASGHLDDTPMESAD